MSDANPLIPGKAIVLYDGVCGLCNRAVQFILKRDRHDQFRFAALQSDIARGFLAAQPETLDTMYLVVNPGAPDQRLFARSHAAIAIAQGLGGIWNVLSIARFLPRFLRDAVYNLVARNRYAIFGKHDICPIPSPEQRAKFLA